MHGSKYSYLYDIEDNFIERFENSFSVNIPESRNNNDLKIKIMEARQQLSEISDAMILKKEEFKTKMLEIANRRISFQEKEQELESSLAKFDYYIRENDDKKLRAIAKADLEKIQKNAKEQELALEFKNLEATTSVRNKCKEKLERLLRYYYYLEVVVEKSEDFNEIRDVLSRYETLTQTYKELKQTETVSQLLLEKNRTELCNYIYDASKAILDLNNRLISMQYQFNKLLYRTTQMENQYAALELTASQKTLELGMIHMTTYSMFHTILKQSSRMASSNSAAEDYSTIEQLDKICNYIIDMNNIIDEVGSPGSQVLEEND